MFGKDNLADKPCFSCLVREYHAGCGFTHHVKRYLQKLLRKVSKLSGQSLIEYSLVLALIAIVVVLVLRGIGGKVNNTLSSVNDNLP
jgi:pilus assembly protein Flp/PilA